MGTVIIGNASIDENGKAYGGKAGDQTEKEVCVRYWYNHKKGWRVFRAPVQYREAIAEAMEAACWNDLIGYNQYNRDSLLNAVKGKGFDPTLCDKAVDCDCSSLVRVCIAYAWGYDRVGTSVRFSTANMPTLLPKYGFVEITEHTNTSDYLMRGDILVTKTQGHTAIVLDDGPKAEIDPPVEEETDCPYRAPRCNQKRGMRGESVKWLQWHLSMVYDGSPSVERVDGIFGKVTERIVREYQAARGLKVDGIAGKQTCTALRDEYAAMAEPEDDGTDQLPTDPDVGELVEDVERPEEIEEEEQTDG